MIGATYAVQSDSALSKSSSPFTLLVLGDSLSASYGIAQQSGWVTLLQKRLNQSGYKVSVVNASISGDTTAGGRARLPRALETHKPDLVLLELGGNDGLQGLPVAHMRRNLEEMIDLAHGSGAQVLLLGIRVPPNYGHRYSDMFEQAFLKIAEAKNVPLVPFILQDVAENKSLMQRDGIHPTAAAQPTILDNIWPFLINMLDG